MEVEKIIDGLDTKKATGINSISNIILTDDSSHVTGEIILIVRIE